MLAISDYRKLKPEFEVDRDLIREALEESQPLAITALHNFARNLWKGQLPVYVSMTTPASNGGWGHLMPLWFKPAERPVPFYTLENWTLFAMVYRYSFGQNKEIAAIADKVFTVENIVRFVAGNNLLLPFLPSTDGQGYFFRHGMLPYLLSILWQDDDVKSDLLKLHQSGARKFIQKNNLLAEKDVFEWLSNLEHEVFARLERNQITDDESVEELLSNQEEGSLIDLYLSMFGAISLGITALANHYQDKPLDEWASWFYQELSFPYRTPHFAEEAIETLLQSEAVNV